MSATSLTLKKGKEKELLWCEQLTLFLFSLTLTYQVVTLPNPDGGIECGQDYKVFGWITDSQ